MREPLVIHARGIFEAWQALIIKLIEEDEEGAVSPRGYPCSEITGVTLRVDDARNNVLISPTRDMNYRFMVAEWLWIWFGRSDVETIGRFNSKIVQFSDDGLRFFGAYGPQVAAQWSRAHHALMNDPDTRQAVIEIFPQATRPLITRDVPCTLSLQFLRRGGRLDTIVTMRSSDVWLGLPYDFFTFSQLGNIMAAQTGDEVGYLQMNLGSSHLYHRDLVKAKVAHGSAGLTMRSPALVGAPAMTLERVLIDPQTDANFALYGAWWEDYGRVLKGDRRDALATLPCEII